MEIETRRLADLKPADYNPRKKLEPGDPEYEKIARSIEEFGYCDPIIINRDGTIIGGHQRTQVLLDMGAETADCVVVDLDPDKEKALNIALNKITGSWDEAKLADLIGSLDLEGYDLTKTGYSEPELKYTVSLTYYINQSDNNRAAAIQQAVSAAVDSYIAWQRKIGRDINPSKLLALVMGAGAKRAQITAPIFTAIPADSIAAIDGTASITYGGLEDD